MTEILQCPFCASDQLETDGADGMGFSVLCFDCLAIGPLSDSEDLSIARWNKARDQHTVDTHQQDLFTHD